MDTLTQVIKMLNGIAWGPFSLALLSIVGVYLTVALRAFPWRNTFSAFATMWRSRKPSNLPGMVTPFKSLMTALSATVGIGNIAGVATAIFLGGPGAIFWMWLIALFGMATKYAEAVLAVKFRSVNEKGEHVGGPMHYIEKGLPRPLRWLGVAYAFFGMIAAFGIGNMVQSNTLAMALNGSFAIPTYVIGGIVAVCVALVIIGGIRRIADFASMLVPSMCVTYMVLALVVLAFHYENIPAAFALIIESAFSGTAATGGFAGAGVWAAIQFGVARGIFSNEAGMGSAAIAHATAKTDNPVRQGKIAMLGTFIDTLIICTITALLITSTGVWTGGETGALLTAAAFDSITPAPFLGKYILPIVLSVFALTTIFGWSYYGERCFCHLLRSERHLPVYRIAWIAAIFVGAITELELVWLIADTLNGFMMLPNLIALLLLSPIVIRLTRQYLTSSANATTGSSTGSSANS